jgi:hypothetical protein
VSKPLTIKDLVAEIKRTLNAGELHPAGAQP